MTSSQVTFEVRGPSAPGEVFAICGSCSALGNWNPQAAVVLQTDDCELWKATVELVRGVPVKYRYFKGYFLEPKTIDGPCEVIVHTWETHLQPRSITPLENEMTIDDGYFGIHNGIETVDAGWLTCQTEIRLRLHYSEKPPVVITKKKFKTSRFRVKLTLEGLEKDEDDDEGQEKTSPTVPQKMANTVEFSLITNNEYKCRHSQPDCGYALQPDRWIEYTIQTMEPDNLELIFDFFEEDLSEKVLQDDELPGHVGSACLLSSTIAEFGKSAGILTLAIMGRNPRKTIGKVRVDYIIIKPIQGYTCDMKASYAKYWKPRTTLDVGHRGAGNSTTTAKLAKVQENTIASLRNAASHGAAYVEFDVHLSKDHVPIVYHDLTCCMAMKKKLDTEPLELFEIAVKELTFDQLQLLKLAHVTALKVKDHNASFKEEENSAYETQPFPSLQRVLESVSEDVGFNIEIKWICQQRDGQWDGNLSTYFDMNLFLDIILKTILMNAGRRRIVFSSFNADICTMVRHKQNKYPVLFLTQGESKIYPELMDLRSRTTPIAITFAQFENLLGVNVHSEDLLRNPSFIKRAKSKGLVIFSWGDDANDPDNRKKLREYGVHGLIYDRIYDSNPEQPNIFQVEQLERLKKELPELKSCVCPTVSHFKSISPCKCHHSCLEEKTVDNLQSVQMQKD
ncbi:glycerophosphocholine phosphodiesterase GPCPD1 isoform X1 [Anas acuta]|uniref:Glycerophosphocholine phosphodiesterase GPCPD1 n=4 Tax=Anas TaxID=8835 RepID=U3ILF6_ANAPP|nr:glycerophosphocholine phosphodiesterase GPCPD1 isoform X1 [Anas platyrhynchos]XP_012954590.1 glycerophosphocholine phosphodiesterase GPCPD1 isoform X1 [Anas platyrhynchos]XP_027309271.1 glycerophosphocholine phosphodiesterase GPCPD1 isoform X1 [Anas platyrhynchos]XP_027309273.1 glycerophosphocholine phosphodiesterase GPCPD1 isoform X1 [Anas platyrhynchos]XP_038032134.1 glycerophosphocholine phosphodiesterase GPCPD1 isoform X1 [Anas platyrhynchos]XP_038032135.1 glycerophosphocholine phosphod|eukprot:XP_005019172.1 glycerophosphocholine phosphodiesterase GPCPD1 isoform X1 [Anas platyrhynchos]